MSAGAVATLPAPAPRTQVLVSRVRFGIYTAIVAVSGMGLSELLLRPHALDPLDGTQLYAIAVLLCSSALLRVHETEGWAICIGLFALAMTCVAMERVAVLSGEVPVQGYIALVMGTAAMAPWGLRGQIGATIVVTVGYWLNVRSLPDHHVFLTSRESSSVLVAAAASLYITWILDREHAANVHELHRESTQREELERRVRERTLALSESNKALSAEVSDRRRLQDQLLLISDSFPGFLGYVDGDQRYVWVNHAYETYWRRPRTEIVGRRMSELHTPVIYRLLEEHIAQALDDSSTRTEVYSVDGLRAKVEVTVMPHRGPDGALHGFVILGLDISAREAAEEQTRRTERLAALGTLAAGIAHEINNPAASILATAEMARDSLHPTENPFLDEALTGIAKEAMRCGQIVRGILRFAREEAPLRALQPILGVVERAGELLRGELALTGASLHIDCSATPEPIAIDASGILQVVLNLATNALRAQAKVVTIRSSLRPAHLALEVIDDGRGMSTAEGSRAFDPFFTTARGNGGTGLGLSISHTIVAQHGGTIEIRSAAGTGTTVTVVLPRQSTPPLPMVAARTGT